jgi:hypothetical protein
MSEGGAGGKKCRRKGSRVFVERLHGFSFVVCPTQDPTRLQVNRKSGSRGQATLLRLLFVRRDDLLGVL